MVVPAVAIALDAAMAAMDLLNQAWTSGSGLTLQCGKTRVRRTRRSNGAQARHRNGGQQKETSTSH